MKKFQNVRAQAILALAVLAVLVYNAGCNMNGSSASPATVPPPGPVAHSVSLAWQASPSSNLQGYKVYRGQSSGGPYSPISSVLTTGTLQFTDSGVTGGKTYFYVITSIDLSGLESAPSPEVSAQVPTP